MLVLKNGGILEGLVTRTGDYFLLTRGDDSEVRLPATDVEFACQDLEDAYRRKRSLVKPGSLREHMQLAQWCLRHELTARAADQILVAWTIDPRHPLVAAVERRLERVQSAVAQAASAKAPAAPHGYVSPSEIDEALAVLKPDAVEQFTIEVQPVLLNRCGAATCHGHASPTAFQLDRPTGRGTMTRRFTQRNLYSTLRQVDRQFPENSPLLAAASAAHGGAAEAVLGDGDSHIARLLAQWVKKAADNAEGVASLPPQTIRRDDAALLQATDEAPEAGIPRPIGERTPNSEPPGHEDAVESQDGIEFRPRDEFDPQIFNLRYGADSPSAP